MPALTPPVDYDAIRTALVAAGASGTGLDPGQVICLEAEDPHQDRPAKPYLAMKITTPSTRYGDDVAIPTGVGTAVVYGGPRGMTVSWNAYGRTHEEAYGVMATLQAAHDTPLVRDVLALANVAVWKVGSIVDLSLLLETAYEGRAQMDVSLGTASNFATDTGQIAQVEVQGAAATGTSVATVDTTVILGA